MFIENCTDTWTLFVCFTWAQNTFTLCRPLKKFESIQWHGRGGGRAPRWPDYFLSSNENIKYVYVFFDFFSFVKICLNFPLLAWRPVFTEHYFHVSLMIKRIIIFLNVLNVCERQWTKNWFLCTPASFSRLRNGYAIAVHKGWTK